MRSLFAAVKVLDASDRLLDNHRCPQASRDRLLDDTLLSPNCSNGTRSPPTGVKHHGTLFLIRRQPALLRSVPESRSFWSGPWTAQDPASTENPWRIQILFQLKVLSQGKGAC